jgi:hypothetical protein
LFEFIHIYPSTFVDPITNATSIYDHDGPNFRPTKAGAFSFSQTSLAQAYFNIPGMAQSGIICYQYNGITYVYDTMPSNSTTGFNYLYPINLSVVSGLNSTLASIGMTVTSKFAPLTNTYVKNNNYYYYDGTNFLYPLFASAPLTVIVTSSSLATNYTRATLSNGFVYYNDASNNPYVYDGISKLYLLSNFPPSSPPTIYGSPLLNGYLASSTFGFISNNVTYHFYSIPTTLSLLQFLNTSNCDAACGNNEMIFN